MSVIKSDFSTIVTTKNILFIPTCVMVEMLTEFYSQISTLNQGLLLNGALPNLLALLKRLTLNLSSAAGAYEKSHSQFFIGDWREDKSRARAIYFNLAARLGYLGEFLAAAEREMLRQVVNEMHRSWSSLEDIMDRKSRKPDVPGERNSCRYFRTQHPTCWKQLSARILISLHGAASYEQPDTYLILLCYSRVRTRILNEVDKIEHQNNSRNRLPSDRVLFLSDENNNITCPTCMTMTEELRHQDPIVEKWGGNVARDLEPQPGSSRTTTRFARSKTTPNSISLARLQSTRVNPVPQGLVAAGLARRCRNHH